MNGTVRYEKNMQGNNKHVGRGFSPDALEIPFIRNASGLKPRPTCFFRIGLAGCMPNSSLKLLTQGCGRGRQIGDFACSDSGKINLQIRRNYSFMRRIFSSRDCRLIPKARAVRDLLRSKRVRVFLIIASSNSRTADFRSPSDGSACRRRCLM
jgi:hypothetical protein